MFNNWTTLNYVATLPFFSGISCVTLMMKFGGFKASLNIFNSKRQSKDHDEYEPGLCISGAYRTNRDEYFGNDRVYEPPKRLTPSMVKLPQCQGTVPDIRPSKSSGDLTKPNNNLPANLRYSTPSVSLDPRGEEERQPRNSRNGTTSAAPNAKQEKEQEKVRKKQLAEQKARDKLAAKERAKQEKLATAKEKKEAKDKSKKDKKVKSPVAQPPQQSTSSTTTTVVVQQRSANPLAQGSNYTTNTLDSSISKSSGPPPYTEVPNTVVKPESTTTAPKPVSVKRTAPQPEPVPKQNDGNNDVIFSEPIDTGSWDMVTQHRQQVSKATKTTMVQSKQRVMDLNYNLHNDKDNSDA